MKCPLKVYLYDYIYPFFNPPMEGLPTLSEAFEVFLQLWDGERLPPEKGSNYKFKNAKAFTLQVDCDMVRRWHQTYTEANKKLLMRRFNQYLEQSILVKGGYK